MSKITIIAEAGVNHNGDIQVAKQLIDVAVSAGVDYVKFQTFKADTIVSKSAQKAEYQKENIKDNDNSQYAMLKALELSNDQHKTLIDYCQTKGINFFSTAFDVEGLDYLLDLGFQLFKIPSGEITNYPYLKKLASFNKPIILSTGMSTLAEIEEAIIVLTSGKLTKKDITVLHCNTQYPTPMIDVNLMAMLQISDELGVEVGYSDHTLGIEVPIAAVALGARVIEKHFTLDRNLSGPDHLASLEPTELIEMVSTIRNIELAISGSGKKEVSNSEKDNIAIVRKSIHTKKKIDKGEVFSETNLTVLRPADGISPMLWTDIIGKKASTDLSPFHKLSKTDYFE